MDLNVLNEGLARVQSGGFKALETYYTKEFASKRRLVSGRRAYAVLDDIPDKLINSEMAPRFAEGRLPEFRDMWEESGRNAFASAIYAQLLFNTGYAFRGTNWARNVSQEGWDKLASYTEEAHDVLLQSSQEADRCPLWHRVLHSIGLSDGSDTEQLEQRFQRARQFDPCDVDIYWTRAYHLLPRWHGSYEEIEAFAKDSVTRTQHELGTSIYARIYTSIRGSEHISETDANWQTMKKSFEDWAGLVNSQRPINMYASMASLFGDEKTLRSIVSNRMTEFHAECWQDNRQAAVAFETLLK